MSKGTEFLIEVTRKLEERIQKLDATIQDVQKDIADMNEYYWENYTEMDQYGYENYDNQQALLTQMNASVENHKYRQRLKKMLDAPFFGSVEFVYDGEDEAEDFYIGIGNFAEEHGKVPLIYDWRAPVSSLFYDYDKGEACYEAPGGIMEGEILSKWQYKIRHGKMVYEFESDVKIDDDILKQELGANSDTQLKNIVRTIQKEQNAIIRNTKDKILAIQGAAGSGKTSVALHRIAYLLYHDRQNLNSSNVLVLSPNGVFSDYISHVLPELGEEHIQEMSLDLFAYKELKGIAADCEDRYHQIERRIAGVSEEDEQRFQWKQSKEFLEAVEGFLIELEDRLVDFRDVTYRGFQKSADEILDFFYYKHMNKPILSRMEAIQEYFVDEYETLYGRNLSEEELMIVQEKFDRMYVTKDIYEIYNWFLEENGWPTLPELPVEKRILSYEDVYPILYFKYRLLAGMEKKKIRHLVIDEMQDYSYLQYVMIQMLFKCNMTILGDKAQTVDDQMQDVLKFLPKIFGKHVRKIEMNKSYRNTEEIAKYAEKVSNVKGIEYLGRHGKEVEVIQTSSKEACVEHILKKLQLGEEGYETAAILTMTEQEAWETYLAMKKMREDVSYIDRDTAQFKNGVTITTFYMAKGLEFDQVFVLGGEKEHGFYRQFQYICATRALHELYIYEK